MNTVEKPIEVTQKNLLRNISSSMIVINNSWNHFITKYINVRECKDCLDELFTILVIVNFIKDLCHAKRMHVLGSMAEDLEIALTELSERKNPPEQILYDAVSLKINELTEKINSFLCDSIKLDDEGDEEEAHNRLNENNIFIISSDIEFITECSNQVEHYGYNPYFFESLGSFLASFKTSKPVAIIADLDAIDMDVFSQKKEVYEGIPLVAIHYKEDFESRLKAAKIGATSFVVKPVNISLLLDKINSLVQKNFMPDPYRVLVIDDSKTISTYLSKTLSKEGMVVHVETKPEDGLAMIGKFQPDLILMDMYMPICDGEHLCRIIRQHENFTSIPIVFLSSETDIQKQLNAMKIGADDFLTKEINPQHLIMSLTTRIQRHRVLSSFMTRDSLTGLLNHTSSKNQLEQLLSKGMELGVPVSFAMLDIDHFKRVNDTYGHPTGDRVIKSLSRLLQQRLRKTDSIGRYGGEEFAVVLWDTDANKAKHILDKLRDSFSKIEHFHDNTKFHTTFSSGVACSNDFHDATAISNAADKALYEAKRAGRNQVAIARNY